MADNDTLDKAADRLLKEADKTGVAVTKVNDGHILVFTKEHLIAILAKVEASGQDKVLVFVKDRMTLN